MMKDKDDDANATADDRSDQETSPREKDPDESSAGETGAHETKHFERPDNLRRRSEWFQKRTGRG